MKASTALKAASLISLLFAVGHTLGGRSSWSPAGDTPTLAAMRGFHMNVYGAERSYLDFYTGFGYSLSVYMLLQAVLLWLLARLSARDPPGALPFVAAFLIAALVNATVSAVWIFALPVAFWSILALCLAVALALCAGSRRGSSGRGVSHPRAATGAG